MAIWFSGNSVQFSSVQFIDFIQAVKWENTQDEWKHEWKSTKKHQNALTITLKLGLEKNSNDNVQMN